jgi:hypothetical protein
VAADFDAVLALSRDGTMHIAAGRTRVWGVDAVTVVRAPEPDYTLEASASARFLEIDRPRALTVLAGEKPRLYDDVFLQSTRGEHGASLGFAGDCRSRDGYAFAGAGIGR